MTSSPVTDMSHEIMDFNTTDIPRTPILTDEVYNILEPSIWLFMLPWSVMGLVTNIINIRVFVKQGVRNDSTNIGFVCLSAWDLLGCATLIPYSLCFIVRFTDGFGQHLTCKAFAMQFVYAHISFQQVGAWTTVYISLIRSFCVIFPLKVKFMFSPKTTILFIATSFIFFAGIEIAYGLLTILEWTFHPGLNMTIAVVRDTPAAQEYIFYALLIINQILPILAVIIVSINTALLSRKLLEVRRWRQKNSSISESEAKQDDKGVNSAKKPLASKEIELIKFINTVTSIFLVCVLLNLLPSFPVMLLHEVNFTGLNSNLFFILWWIRFVFDVINSSINFFFYIRVSSRFKEAFASSFKICAHKCCKES